MFAFSRLSHLSCALSLLCVCQGVGAMSVAQPEHGGNLPVLEPTLRLALAPQAVAAAIDEDERRLLRVEWRSGLSRVEEGRAVEELLLRIGRMEMLVADIAQGVKKLPDWRQPQTSLVWLAADAARPTVGTIAWFLVGMGALSALLVFHRRRRKPVIGPTAAPTVSFPEPIPVRQTASKAATKVAAHKAAHRAVKVSPVGTASSTVSAIQPAGESAAVWLTPAVTEPPASAPAAGHTPPPLPHPEASHGEVHELSMLLQPDTTVELANIMLSMGLTKGAEDALLHRIRDNPRHALYYWLKLLEVYRCTGMQEQFEQARAELHAHYNVAPHHWLGNDADASHSQTLEDFHHIAAQLIALWPGQKAGIYLERLLADNREGTRNGFPQPVAEEMLLLIAMLETRA